MGKGKGGKGSGGEGWKGKDDLHPTLFLGPASHFDGAKFCHVIYFSVVAMSPSCTASETLQCIMLRTTTQHFAQ